jgi:hypothetical protein
LLCRNTRPLAACDAILSLAAHSNGSLLLPFPAQAKTQSSFGHRSIGHDHGPEFVAIQNKQCLHHSDIIASIILPSPSLSPSKHRRRRRRRRRRHPNIGMITTIVFKTPSLASSRHHRHCQHPTTTTTIIIIQTLS